MNNSGFGVYFLAVTGATAAADVVVSLYPAVLTAAVSTPVSELATCALLSPLAAVVVTCSSSSPELGPFVTALLPPVAAPLVLVLVLVVCVYP